MHLYCSPGQRQGRDCQWSFVLASFETSQLGSFPFVSPHLRCQSLRERVSQLHTRHTIQQHKDMAKAYWHT